MDAVSARLDELVRLVESARAMPLSSSVVLHRGELLGLLDDLRAALPEQVAQAQQVLAERDALLEQGRQDAARLVAEAERERERLVEATDVHRSAAEQAQRLLDDADEQAAVLQVQVDDYVDGKLATFEIVLHKTLSAVERGRAKLAGRSALDELAGSDGDEPLPQ